MREIQDAIRDRLKDDSTLQGYTGYTAENTRIYWQHPPSLPALNGTYTGKAYIIMYSYTSGGKREIGSGAWPNRTFSIEVRSANAQTNAIVAKRIVDLLDEYKFTTTTHPAHMWVEYKTDRELGLDQATMHMRLLLEFEVANITYQAA